MSGTWSVFKLLFRHIPTILSLLRDQKFCFILQQMTKADVKVTLCGNGFHFPMKGIRHFPMILYIHYTRSLLALRAPTFSWKPFGPFDFVLRALRALRPCDPRHHPSQVNTITLANTITQPTPLQS